MAVELKFIKSDSSTSWGFRLIGGADFDQPIIVTKVNEKSLAKHSGLQVNDIIVRIEDTATAGLTHTQVHDLLHAAGNEFVIGIRRGEVFQSTDEEANAEVSCILEQISSSEESEHNILLSQTTEIISVTTEVSDLSPSLNLSGQEELIDPMTVNKNITTENKTDNQQKWSTFLQKPKNTRPKPKLVQEEDNKSNVEPYRVVIKKQRRRTNVNKKHVEFKQEESLDAGEEENVMECSESTSGQMEVDVEINVQEQEDITVEIDELELDASEEDKCQDTEISALESEEGSEVLNMQINKVETQPSLSLEEQLAEVQKQLQALSQLPSTIQVTLDAVTKQLAKIVSAKSQGEEECVETTDAPEEESAHDDEEKTEQLTMDDEILEDSLNSVKAEADITGVEEEHEPEEDQVDGSENEVENIEHEDEQEVKEVDDGLTVEEREAKKLAEEKLAKKQKEMDQRPAAPLRPIQRPIILPGGRRWSEPEDACPKIRNPKMSDEKIADTIETYSEVIVGKAKGINFLKYQPPPKNLDYLQRSEVYRLVHDMEPPVRGISTRAEKILAVQDYYEGKGEP